MAPQGPEVRRIADRHAHVRVNERIRAREIRVVDDEGKQLGVMPPFEALKIARQRGLDLVEVSPTANPPVCRIINYGKYLYQQSKRQHEARKHQRSIELKEVKFRPRTGTHDFEVKRSQIARFLEEGNKVKATVMFRGREMAHRNLGWEMINRLVKDLGELVIVEIRPRQEGPNLTTILAPKKAASGKPARPASSSVPRPAAAATAAPAKAASPSASHAGAAPKPAPPEVGVPASSGGTSGE